MTLSALDAAMLLRVLRDPRVDAIAVEYYALGPLDKLIATLEQITRSAPAGPSGTAAG